MRLQRIEFALEQCEQHLEHSAAYGTEIESLLTQSVLVIMCAEFEQKIEDIVRSKCGSVEDKAIKEFLSSCVAAVFRSVKSSELAGLLNRFGPEYKDAYKVRADDQQRAVTYYNNIVTNRHAIAHHLGSTVSFREAKLFYEEGHVVLDFFNDVLLTDEPLP